MTSSSRIRCWLYGAVALFALGATWSQNLTFLSLPDHGGGLIGFLRACTSNAAAASVTYDIVFFSLAAFVWMGAEARRLKIRGAWIYIALSILIAVSVMFPLFLIARERRLATT